jgi:hypothetical protein
MVNVTGPTMKKRSRSHSRLAAVLWMNGIGPKKNDSLAPNVCGARIEAFGSFHDANTMRNTTRSGKKTHGRIRVPKLLRDRALLLHGTSPTQNPKKAESLRKYCEIRSPTSPR